MRKWGLMRKYPSEMGFEDVVAFIVAHHDSAYLLPFRERLAVDAVGWNGMMFEAWRRMGLSVVRRAA